MDSFISDVVFYTLGVVFTVDLVLRIRAIRLGRLEAKVGGRIGILPLPVLAGAAIVATLFVGWLGWVLGCIAGLASVSNLRITNLPDASWERPLLHGLLVFAHILVTAVCLKVLLINITEVFLVIF